MDFDGVLFAVFTAGLLLLAGFGFESTVVDHRRFSTVVEQCKKQGYIQDENTRIYCQVEVK